MGMVLKVARKLIGAAKIKEISIHNPAHRPHLFRQSVSQGMWIGLYPCQIVSANVTAPIPLPPLAQSR
jgi:hypothetical protein